MVNFKLNDTEEILENDYLVHYGYVYTADMKPVISYITGTVKDLKQHLNVKEIRRCDSFGHPNMTMSDTFIL